MKYHRVVALGYKFERVKVLNYSFLPPGSDRLFASFSPSVDFHMDHVMLLSSELSVVVGPRAEDKIAWLQIFKLQLNRQRIKLVSLVPSVQLKAKLVTQIVHNLTYEGTTVEEYRAIIMLVTRFVVAPGNN